MSGVHEVKRASMGFRSTDSINSTDMGRVSFRRMRRAEMNQEFFSPEEIARLLGIAPYTVRELCRRGKMRHARVGRRIRIKRQWAEEYMSAREREPLL